MRAQAARVLATYTYFGNGSRAVKRSLLHEEATTQVKTALADTMYWYTYRQLKRRFLYCILQPHFASSLQQQTCCDGSKEYQESGNEGYE